MFWKEYMGDNCDDIQEKEVTDGDILEKVDEKIEKV